MYIKRVMFLTCCILLVITLVACRDDSNKGLQSDSTTTIQKEPTTTVLEQPATPEPMESPLIPDEDNVSLPDPD